MKKLYINQRIGKTVFFLLMLVFIGGRGLAQSAYIPNSVGSITVLNLATNTVTAIINVGSDSYGVSVNDNGTRVYVTDDVDNTMSVINTSTNTVIATVGVGQSPNGVVVSHDGSKVYVANYNGHSVNIIDASTNTVTDTIIVGGYPVAITISADGSKVFVVNQNGYVSFINTITKTVTAIVDFGGSEPYDVCITPDGSKLYVTDYYNPYVTVINTITDTIDAEIALSGGLAGIVSLDGSKVYIANYNSVCVNVINTATNTLLTTIPINNGYPEGISITADGSKVYTSNVNIGGATEINTATNTVIRTITTFHGGWSVKGNFISTFTCNDTSAGMPAVSADLTTICHGGSAILSVDSGTLHNATFWHWYSGSCGGTSVGIGNSITVNPATTTTYYARGEGTCATPGPCASITITVRPVIVLTAPLHLSTKNACIGQSNGVIKINPSGGTAPYAYAWTPSEGTAGTISNLPIGPYTVTVTDVYGCTNTTTATITTTHIALTYPTHISTVNSCYGMNSGKIMVSPAGGNTPYTYLWTPFLGNHATVSNLTAGNYTVKVTDNNGCTNSNTAIIYQTSQVSIIPPYNITQVNAFCYGAGIINVHPAGGTTPYSYSWSPNVGTTATVSNLIPGNYTVTVTDNIGCTNTAWKSISGVGDHILLNIPQNFNSTLVTCFNGSDGIIYVNPAGGAPPYTYSWTPSEGTNATVSNVPHNVYTVTVTDQNGCTITNTKTVVQNGQILLVPTQYSSQTNPTCALNNNGISRMFPGGGLPPYTYSWSPNVGTTATVSNLSAGTYWVTVTDSYGCHSSGKVILVCTSRLEELNGNTSLFDFNVYPNPAEDIVTIAFSSDKENSYSISLIDIMGRLVKSETDNASIGDNTHIMNIEGIAKGIYILELRMGDRINKVKLVVQ